MMSPRRDEITAVFFSGHPVLTTVNELNVHSITVLVKVIAKCHASIITFYNSRCLNLPLISIKTMPKTLSNFLITESVGAFPDSEDFNHINSFCHTLT